MLNCRMLMVSIILTWAMAAGVQGEERDPKSDRTPAIARSGDVEISSIEITRKKAADAAKEADLTNMQLELWLTRKWTQDAQRSYLVKLLELGPIEDSTGRNLLTKQRLQEINYLDGMVNPLATRGARAMVGPIVKLTVDAPAREATRIKSIKGKAIVSRMKLTKLEFDNLNAIEGKALEHPKLKGFELRASVDVEDDNTTLTLTVPRDVDRLVDWGLSRKFLPLRAYSQGKSKENGEHVLTKMYAGDHTNKGYLYLSIAELTETRTLEFEFKDVELP